MDFGGSKPYDGVVDATSESRRMSGEQKLRAVGDLYRAARKLKAAALRDRHPEWTEARLSEAVTELFLHART